MVVGVTDEAPELVEPCIAKLAVSYPIAIETRYQSYQALRVVGASHAFLVDPQGLIVWSGYPKNLPEAEVEQALQGARVPGYALGPGLEAAAKQIEKFELGKAHETVLALLARGLDGRGADAGRQLLARLEGEGKDLLDAARAHIHAGDFFAATAMLRRLQQEYGGVPGTEAGNIILRQLAGDASAQKAVKGGEQLLLAKGLDCEREYDKAHAMYRALSRSHAGTRPADQASTRAREIERLGLLGYQPVCQACQKLGRACDKHARPLPK